MIEYRVDDTGLAAAEFIAFANQVWKGDYDPEDVYKRQGLRPRRRTAPAWPTFWSIPCSAARRSFR